MKGIRILRLTLVCMMVAVFFASFASAAEFVYDKGPKFRVTYPDEWLESPDNPGNVLLVTKKGGSIPVMNIEMRDIPDGISLEDANIKSIKEYLEKSRETEVAVVESKQITLKDGTPAYEALLKWTYQGFLPLVTRVVSAYKDKKWVYVTLSTGDDTHKDVPRSLTFE